MAYITASVPGPATGATPFKIAVVGSLNMDFINFVPQHSPPNGHVQAKGDIQAPGGHGANQAVACAKLSELPQNYLSHQDPYSRESSRPPSGIEVSMFGVVGDRDLYGEEIKDELRQNKVNIDNIHTISGARTGYAHVHVDDNGLFHVMNNLGASEKYLPEQYNLFDNGLKPDAVLVQLEIKEEMVLHALAWAKRNGAMTICNAAPATHTVRAGIYKVDHFIVNELQADTLYCLNERPFPSEDRINKQDTMRQHYLKLCANFHEYGATCVVVTMAELGAVGSRKDPVSGVRQQYIFDAEQGQLPVKDTTGASDTFIGGYTVGLVHQKQAGLKEDMASAMQLGIKAAGLSVSQLGSMRAIPTPDNIMEARFRAVGS